MGSNNCACCISGAGADQFERGAKQAKPRGWKCHETPAGIPAAGGKNRDGQCGRFSAGYRADRQNEIKQQLTEQYYKPVEATQTANASNATVQGNVSSDYQQAKAASDTNQLKAAKDFAGLYGQQESAYRLRQNEGLKMADNANQIARINNFSRGMDNVDQYAIRQAARPDGALSFGSQVLGMIGSSMIKGQGKPGNVGFT